MTQLQKEYEKKYGPGNYVPDVFIQYWSMRVMAYLGSLILLLALWGGWLVHRGTLERSKWFLAHLRVGGDHAVLDEHRRLAA